MRLKKYPPFRTWLWFLSLIPWQIVLPVGGAEMDIFHSKIPITPELANEWAGRILDNIFEARHKPLLDKLSSPSTLSDVEAMRNILLEEYQAKDPAKYEKLKATSAEDYINSLRTGIQDGKKYNTIGVRVDGDNKIYVAGNVKSSTLPAEPTDRWLFEKVAFKPSEVYYPSDQFHLQDFDAPEIRKGLKDSGALSPGFFGSKEPQVFMLSPEGQGIIDTNFEASKKDAWDGRVAKLTEDHQKGLLTLEQGLRAKIESGEIKPKNREAFIQEQIGKKEEAFKRKLAMDKVRFEKDNLPTLERDYLMDKAHVYHAEMQLQHVKVASLEEGSKVIFGVSRSLCDKCVHGIDQGVLTDGRPAKDVIDYKQYDGKPGLEWDKVQNWDHPPSVKVTPLEDLEAVHSKKLADAEVENRVKPIDIAGCTRRKRSASSCRKLDARAFADEYAGSTEEKKARLAEIGKDFDVVGSGKDAKNVKSLVQLENLKAHNKALSGSKLTDKGNKFWGTVKSTAGKVKTKLSQTAVAKKLSKFSQSKGFSGASSAIGKASAPIGIFLLGKSVVNGIIHRDYTSLGIIGGKLAIDATGYISKGVGKAAAIGSKTAKASNFIGKVAGPIGVVADVGLSIWSLTKAVDRLNSGFQFDRNDAIADIVQESIDIGITAAVVVATIAFPPTGIIIAVAGVVLNLLTQLITGHYKTHNEVQRIHADVPLLDWERNQQFTARFFDWFGTRKDDYIDDLVTTKKLNDLFVAHHLSYFRENPHLAGIAFPARSIAYSGSCKYTRNHCSLKNIWGCTKKFQPEVVLARGCDQGAPCDGYKCSNWWKSTGWKSYDDYRCVCDQSSNVKEGYPRMDNYVDFRKKRAVYLERAVPKDVKGARFKCKPGYEDNQGHRVTQGYQTVDEYLCKGTIALYQPLGGGETFYFDLEKGKDTVLLDPFSSEGNTFVIQDGEKDFQSGRGNDTFLIHPEATQVTGLLDGGYGVNSLVLSDGFLKGYDVVFKNSFLKAKYDLVNVRTKSMTEILGRKDQKEVVEATCDLMKVALQGGRDAGSPDVILIQEPCTKTRYPLVILARGPTTVNISSGQQNVQVVVPSDNAGPFIANIEIKGSLSATLIFQHPSKDMGQLSWSLADAAFRITWPRVRLNLQFSGQNIETSDFRTLFTEGNQGPLSSYSQLRLSKDGISLVHTLGDTGTRNGRQGAKGVSNVFLLQSGSWDVEGPVHPSSSVLNNIFVLHGDFMGSIKGGGSTAVLVISESYPGHSEIDLRNGNIGRRLRVSGIGVIHGRPNMPESVTCGCDTSHVATGGGSTGAEDRIVIPNTSSCSSQLTIIAAGNTKVVDETVGGGREQVVQIQTSADKPVVFSAVAHETSSTLFVLQLPKLTLMPNGVPTATTSFVKSSFTCGKNGASVQFLLKVQSEAASRFLQGPRIVISNGAGTQNGELKLDRLGEVTILHQLESPDDVCASYRGVEGLPNYFLIKSLQWIVVGAPSSKNYFVIDTGNQNGGVSCGSITGSSENSLVMQSVPQHWTTRLTYDFRLNWFGPSVTEGIKMTGISHFVGLRNRGELISLTCRSGLSSVDGSGGSGEQDMDTVVITDSDGPQPCGLTAVMVPAFTSVKNTAREGTFVYNITIESGLDVVTLLPTANNFHLLRFLFSPVGIVLGAEKTKSQLRLHFDFNSTLTYPLMVKGDGTLNPQVKFAPFDDSLMVHISLNSEGSLMSKWEIFNSPQNSSSIKGLDIPQNVFVINLAPETKPLSIFGSDTSNQFWLLSGTLDDIEGSPSASLNSLHLDNGYFQGSELLIDLLDDSGNIQTDEILVVKKLSNIHRFYGRMNGNDTVVPSCHTTLVASATVVLLKPHHCSSGFDIDIVLTSKDTAVYLILQEDVYNETVVFTDEPEGTFRYRLEVPMSFTPIVSRRTEYQFLLSDHIYHLPFSLGELTEANFYPWNDTFAYKLSNGHTYFHQMLSWLDDPDEFYRQPQFFTHDGCQIRIGRSGEMTAICQTDDGLSNDDRKTLADTAIRLRLAIVHQSKDQMTYAGTASPDERNILTTSLYSTNHLFGGGAKDTIYDIKHLDKDVFINSGFDSIGLTPTNGTKHTIDLTDVVVPLRMQEKSKFVPLLSRNGEDLVISMGPAYSVVYPGNVIVARGVPESGMYQLLLNSAVMEFKAIGETATSRRKRRSAADEDEEEWVIAPKPIVVDPGSVYSISQEDLEDGHSITTQEPLDDNATTPSFVQARDGRDLLLTNLRASSEGDEPLTIITISNYFPPPNDISPGNDTSVNDVEVEASILFIDLPGLSLELNTSKASLDPLELTQEFAEWEEVLESVEEGLLEDLPNVHPTFQRPRDHRFYLFLGIFLAVLAGIGTGILYRLYWRYDWHLKTEKAQASEGQSLMILSYTKDKIEQGWATKPCSV